MKYLKVILKNPWIVLLLIIFLVNTYHMFVEASIINSFTSGVSLCTLIYVIIDKIHTKHTNDVIYKLEEMASASKIILEDDDGTRTSEDGEEYLRGFRQAALFILRDLK